MIAHENFLTTKYLQTTVQLCKSSNNSMKLITANYGTVQLQLHIITHVNAQLHGKNCCLSRCVAVCPTSTSNMITLVHT